MTLITLYNNPDNPDNPRFEQWADQPHGDRGDDYNTLKTKWEENCLKVMYRLWPAMKDAKLAVCDVSTPLSISHYLWDDEGAACGLAVTPERVLDVDIVTKLNMKTPIKGLWLTGMDTLLCGVPLAQMSGVITGLRMGGFQGAAYWFVKTLKTILLA